MLYSLVADALVLLHLAFILFVVFGALLALRWPRVLWLHAPAFVWGAATELFALICPLTPLEQDLRRAAGEAGFEGGFIDHYLVPLIYPSGLTPDVQIVLGVLLVAWNAALYAWVWRRRR